MQDIESPTLEQMLGKSAVQYFLNKRASKLRIMSVLLGTVAGLTVYVGLIAFLFEYLQWPLWLSTGTVAGAFLLTSATLWLMARQKKQVVKEVNESVKSHPLVVVAGAVASGFMMGEMLFSPKTQQVAMGVLRAAPTPASWIGRLLAIAANKPIFRSLIRLVAISALGLFRKKMTADSLKAKSPEKPKPQLRAVRQQA